MTATRSKPTLDDLTRGDPMWFVCSYPKSGNTWVRALLYNYARRTGLSSHLTRASDLDGYTYASVAPKPVSQLTPSELVQLRGTVLMHLRRREVGPLAVKSHYVNGSMGGVPMFSQLWCDKVIHVVRDPREVAPSFADHMGEDIDHAIEFMRTPHAQLMGPASMSHFLHTWSEHTRSWLTAKNVPVHTITYAGLHRDTEGVLTGILEFLDVPIDEDAVAWAVEQSSFDVLRRNEEQGGFKEKSEHHDRFFRRGKAGAWGDELTDAQADEIERDHGEMMNAIRALGGIAERELRAV